MGKAEKRNQAILDDVLIPAKSPKDVTRNTTAVSDGKMIGDDRLGQKLNEIRNLWDRAAFSRRRSAFDDYMEAVLLLHREFQDQDAPRAQSRRMLKLAKVSNRDKLKDPIRRIIAATSNAHETIANGMALALRFGERKKWPDIKRGLRENGGIVGCAGKLEALENKKTRLEKLDLAISKVLNVA